MRRSRRGSRRRRRRRPTSAAARFVAVLCLACPDGATEMFARRGRGHDRLAAARHQRLRLRPDVRAATATTEDLRRDDAPRRSTDGRPAARRCRTARAPSPQIRRGEAGAAMSDDRASPASASTSTGRSARPSAPIATSTAMSATSRPTRRASPPPSPREIASTAGAHGPARTVSSIFLGGGTPSLMEPATVGAILDGDRASTGRVAAGAEVTLEANPSSVEAERFRGYRAAGVNRVSLGVQALNDADLQLPRPPAQCRRGAARHRDRARDLPAPVLRPDLRAPGPDAGRLGGGAEAGASALAADHLSLYQLTIEDGTPFYALYRAGKLERAGRRPRRRPLCGDAGGLRRRAACRPTRFPTTPRPAPRAATTSSTGATANMPASAPAPTAASSSPTAATRTVDRAHARGLARQGRGAGRRARSSTTS